MKRENHRAKTYTKRDIVRRVAAGSGENLYTAAEWVDRVFVALREIMMTADPELRIEIRDFGVLEVKPTKSKPKARNPKSGEIIFVPPRRKTHFKPSKLLKQFLAQPLEVGGNGRRVGALTDAGQSAPISENGDAATENTATA